MDMWVSMSTLFYLSSSQMDVIRPFFPRSRGIPRRDDQKIISELSMFSSSVSDGRMLQKNTAPIKLFRGCPACFLILKGVVISSHETNRFS